MPATKLPLPVLSQPVEQLKKVFFSIGIAFLYCWFVSKPHVKPLPELTKGKESPEMKQKSYFDFLKKYLPIRLKTDEFHSSEIDLFGLESY